MADFTYTGVIDNQSDGTRSEVSGTLPEFALDSTLEQILNVLTPATKEATKQTKKTQEILEDQKELYEKAMKGDKEAQKEFNKILEDGLNKANKTGREKDAKAQGEYNAAMARSEQVLRSTAKGLQKFGLGALTVASTLAVGFFNAVTSAGETLNELRTQGLAFGDAQGSTIEALGTLSLTGLSGSKFLGEFSRAAGVLGVNTLANMTRQFDAATSSGLDLGLSLSENAEALASELDVRARLGILEGVSAQQMMKETQRQQKAVLLYSQALGIATEDLEAFASSLVTNTNILSGSLLRFNNEVQSQMVAGLKEFGTVMAGLGGEEGQGIAQAMVEAAAGGALGFSDNLVAMTAVLPKLQHTTQELTAAMASGTLTQEQANEMATSFAEELGNLSEGEKQRIFAMERAGVQGATEMANAVRNFESSTRRLEDLRIDPSAVQTGTNALNNILEKLTGMFDALRYSFLEGLGSVDGLNDAFKSAQDTIAKALNEAFGTAGESVKDFGKSIGERMPEFIEKAAKGIAHLIKVLPTIVEGVIAVSSAIFNFVSFLSDHAGKILALGAVILTAVAAVKLFSAYLSAKEFLGMLKGGGAGNKAQKQIMDGAGASGKAAGGMKAFGGGFAAMMKGIVTGLKILGKAAMNPMVWAGLGLITVAVLALATALRIAAPAIEAMGKVIMNVMMGVGAIIESVGKGIAAIVTAIGSVVLKVFEGIGAVIVSVGNAIKAVFEGIGSIIMGIGNAIAGIFLAIGKAAMMAGKGISFIFEGIASMGDSFTNFIATLGNLDGGQLLYAATGILAVGGALVALGAGSLVGGIMKGLGDFFGGDVIDQFIQLGAVAPGIVKMADVMSDFGSVIDKFTEALGEIDGDYIAGQMKILEDAFMSFSEAINQISFKDLFKLAALNLLGVGQGGDGDTATAPTTVPAQVQPASSPTIQKAAKLGDNFTANYSQRDMMSADPELYKEFTEKRRTREQELIEGGTSKQRAELMAEREALKEYAPQITAAGAGTFKDADGNPIKFDADGNVINPNQQQQGTTTTDQGSNAMATGDLSEDILSALNRQNNLLQQLVRQNQVIADNI